MQNQPSAVDVKGTDDELEREVFTLLLGPAHRGPWADWELGPEIGNERATADAVMRLHATGLVHLCHEFVWPTRPAVRMHCLTDTA